MYDTMLTMEELREYKGRSLFKNTFSKEEKASMHDFLFMKRDEMLDNDLDNIVNLIKNKKRRRGTPRSRRASLKDRRYKVSGRDKNSIMRRYKRALIESVSNTLLNGDRFLFSNNVLTLHVRSHRMNRIDNFNKKYAYRRALRGFQPVLNVAIGKGYFYYKGKTTSFVKNLFYLNGSLGLRLSYLVEEKHKDGDVRYSKKAHSVYSRNTKKR